MRTTHAEPVFRFACGHTGRTNDLAMRPKATAFIRVAEIRGSTVYPVTVKCPDCSGKMMS